MTTEAVAQRKSARRQPPMASQREIAGFESRPASPHNSRAKRNTQEKP